MIERFAGLKINIFRSDKGGKFMSAEFNRFPEDNSISRETSAPRTSQQNCLAERMMLTLVGSARTMLQHSGSSNGFWVEVMGVVAYLHNHFPRKGLAWKTPRELFCGRVSDASYLRVFGCHAWVQIFTLDDSGI